MNRRDFLRATSATAFGLGMPTDLFAQPVSMPARKDETWDAGKVRHILPQVSATGLLVKTSFGEPLVDEPSLRVGDTTVRGRMSDTHGEYCQFYVADLQPGRRYTLSLFGKSGRALCQPWELSTFPGRDERPEHVRILFFTCAGGHEALKFSNGTSGRSPSRQSTRLSRSIQLSWFDRHRSQRSGGSC
jgi:hypothetical protein